MASTGEKAVREYLIVLKNPEAARDESRIQQIEQRLTDSDDPIERLQLHAELSQLREGDLSKFEDAFVVHAREWASEQGISADAFESEGVPRDVLQRAGLIAGRRGGGRRRTSGQRRPRVTREDVEAALPRKGQKFSIKDLQERSGGSAATVRNVLADLLERGTVAEVGVNPEHRGPGRAATLYAKQ